MGKEKKTSKVTVVSEYDVGDVGRGRNNPSIDLTSRKIEPSNLKNRKDIKEYFNAQFLTESVYNALGKPKKIRMTETIEAIR